MDHRPVLTHELVDGVHVFSFSEKSGKRVIHLFDEKDIRDAAEFIAQHLPTTGERLRVVVDMEGVWLISSALNSKMILLQRRVDGSHGKMRVCSVSPVIMESFHSSNLDRLFTIVKDQRTALNELR